MSEQEMRRLIREYIDALDRGTEPQPRAGLRGLLLPAALGIGLTLAGCSDPTPIALPYMADMSWRPSDARVEAARPEGPGRDRRYDEAAPALPPYMATPPDKGRH